MHFEAFQDQCITSIDINFDVIGFCETRLNDNMTSLYNLHNFHTFYRNKSTSCGGVAIKDFMAIFYIIFPCSCLT